MRPSPQKPRRSSCVSQRASTLYRLCFTASALYAGTVFVLLWSRGSLNHTFLSSMGRRASADAAGDVALQVPGQLCLPTRESRVLLVEVPFTTFDIGSLETSVALWEQVWPCHRGPLHGQPPPSRPDLVLGFNGNLSEPAHAILRGRLAALVARRAITSSRLT